MTSQPGQWTIAIYILSNISRIKGNQTMKQTFFFKITQKNETERLVPDLFFFFKNSQYEVRAYGQQLSFNIFW